LHGVKQTGRPPSAKVKNEWKYSLPIFPLGAFVTWTGKSLLLLAIWNMIKYPSKSFFLSYFMYEVYEIFSELHSNAASLQVTLRNVLYFF
jgi:hypothetical protein